MFEQARIRLNKWFLKRAHRKRKIIRSSIGLNEARKIGLLVNATDEAHLKAALALADRLKKQNKEVELLVFAGKTKSVDSPAAYPVFGIKELDWAFRPKADHVADFMARSFDLLFYFSQKSEPVLDYIMALSAARFRVGPYVEAHQVCDLMVVPDKADARAFADLMMYYLERLNPSQGPERKKQLEPTKSLAS